MNDPPMTLHVCGKTCDHLFDGPLFESDDGTMVSATCSKCGELAINVSLLRGL